MIATIERRVHLMIDVDTIVQSIAPAVNDIGLDVYDVELTGSGRARILRVLVDREGGVDLDGIAAATGTVSPLLDSAPLDALIPGPYSLEVSSPGLERPLRTPEHFRRAAGETVSVKVRAGDDHPARRVRGVLADVGEAGFDLIVDDGTTMRIAYGDVTQARTIFEWSPQPKRAKSKKATSLREPVTP